MTHPITHAGLGALLDRLRLGIGASDLHGSLTGYLCAGGTADAKTWPHALELDIHGEGDEWNDDGVFADLHERCRSELDDENLGFEPLLPEEHLPLAVRGDALVEWCRGFLGGVGLAGHAHARALSADANEILGDFSTIASSRFDYDGDDGDENALVEVLEFVRVGVLLLRDEMIGPPRQRSTAAGRRLH